MTVIEMTVIERMKAIQEGTRKVNQLKELITHKNRFNKALIFEDIDFLKPAYSEPMVGFTVKATNSSSHIETTFYLTSKVIICTPCEGGQYWEERGQYLQMRREEERFEVGADIEGWITPIEEWIIPRLHK